MDHLHNPKCGSCMEISRKWRTYISNIPELALTIVPSSIASDKSSIPVLGLGTAAYPFVASEAAKEAILTAIQVGYRHFDTAAVYQTEQLLGEAIAEALSLELVKSRDELFLLPSFGARMHTITLSCLPFIKHSNLYLIHWPVSFEPGSYDMPVKKEDLLPMDFKSVWEAMEECQKLGLTKAIGVSNFSCKKIEILLSTAIIPPAVNQVEMNPLWQQKKLKEFCERKGIIITAYSPLGAKATPWGTNGVMECETLKQIAETKRKTLAQVCLRWAYEQGVSVVVKSFNKERIKENMDIFEWELQPEEVDKINQIPQKRACQASDFVSDNGPFKSLEEFWDGEI
ncbi:putative oxidoreductase [Rosa chinensis]|uniref:Putative oxidoreductase n=1 Tax=Rosa chinensis TaxID=74649 RepID=A0A2P6R4D6_ROSCH|nr:putative oxidoreductase [Rosa chinensis]